MKRPWLTRGILPIIISLLLAACGAPATEPPPPAPTQPPATQPLPTQPPPTVVPPTATSAPVATPTAAPTVAPTPAPASNPIVHLAAGQPLTITTIHMFDSNIGWAIGGPINIGDHVLRTGDGGQTWTDVTPPEPASPPETPARAVSHFMDEQTAWAAYSYFNGGEASGVVWRTTDGGQTWQASALVNWADAGDYFDPTDMQFLDRQNGFLLAHLGVGMSHDYVSLYRTRDGGANWERVADPALNNLQMSCGKTGMVFADSQTGWVTGDCYGVAPGVFLQATGDGGQTWQTPELAPPADQHDLFQSDVIGCGTYAAAAAAPQSAVIVVRCVHFTADPIRTDSFLYTTSDGGQTWRLSPTPLPAASASVTFLDDQHGWAQGTADPNNPAAPLDIYQTADGGQTWTKVGSVTWSGSFNFVNDQTGWAIAQAGEALALVATTDGGQKWQLLQPQIGP